MNELIEISVDLIAETEKAWKVDHGNGKPVWVPKSQCELDGRILTLPVWLAREKEMI